ncbi:hypothetical protein HPB49_008044 [Dermacentor silvarum]|uniref:Uncharacterized protein n=1 Tax=Dermacentor silvarum TaxID=543639 RepID=A0ACB8DIS8_DERSI|nr:hypothetical protein HPB49_008044 [Dermacentor silvarum]
MGPYSASEQRSNGGFRQRGVPGRSCRRRSSHLIPNSRAACAALRGPAAREKAAFPKATDFVVVLKPRTQLSLATVFPENGAGRALIAHLGETATRLVTVVMVREQNLILTYTSNPQIAHNLIVPLFGYLHADTQGSCYGIVTVRSSDTEAALRGSLNWPESEILHVQFTFSGKVNPRHVSYVALLIPVQPYKKTVPACGRCGSVGDRPDACPGRKSDLLRHLRNSGRRHPNYPLLYRRIKPAPRSENVDADGKKLSPLPPTLPHPRTLTRGLSGLPCEAKLRMDSQQGSALRGRFCSPHPNRTRRHLNQNLLPRRISWATRVRQEPQVSGSGGAASKPPPSTTPPPKPPTPSTPTREQIAIRQVQAQVASLTQAVEELANRLPSPYPTPSGQAPEAMDSAPSEHRDTTALLAPIEARVSRLEPHVASIVTTIEHRLAATLQTVFDCIPGMIVAQQSKVSIATPDVSTGSSSGAPVDLSALLEAPPPKFLTPTMAGNGSRSLSGRPN